ncbi:MAG: hypothetical protein U0703_07950 [Anaerolineae bacterium]
MLPPVLDVRDAMRPDAPILLDDLRTDEIGQKGSAHITNDASHHSTCWATWTRASGRRR